MKKWMAMVLALCMLCSVSITAAAEKQQTIQFLHYRLNVPDDWYFSNGTLTSMLEDGETTVSSTLGIHSVESGLLVDISDLSAIWDSYASFADVMEENGCELLEKTENGAAFFHEVEDFVSITCYDNGIILRFVFNSDNLTTDQAKELWKFIWNQTTSQPTSKQNLFIGPASFKLDADLEIAQVDGHRWLLKNAQYAVVFYYYEYGEDDIDFTNGDMQFDNCFFINYMDTDDQQTALNVCNLAQRKDIGMPGGDDVLYIAIDGNIMLSHYYPNMGFMMMAQCQDGSLSDDELLAIVEEIALSFRVDGITAEEMAEYKAQAEAELAAIFAPAVQAPDTEAAAEETPAEEDAAQKYVVITNSSANIRSGPDAGTAKVKTGLKGDRFPLLGEENNWYKIDVDGKTAYVSKGLTTVE